MSDDLQGMVRRDDYDTSIAAAAAVDTATIRRRVLALYREFRELGDADLYRLYVERHGHAVDVSVRKRRGELKEAGYLQLTEKRCTFPTGRTGRVWRIVEAYLHADPPPAPAEGKLFP